MSFSVANIVKVLKEFFIASTKSSPGVHRNGGGTCYIFCLGSELLLMCFDLTLRNLERSHCFYSLHKLFVVPLREWNEFKSHPKERNSCYTLVVFLKLSVEYPPSCLEGSILHLAGRLNRHSGNILNSHKIWNVQNIPFKMFLNTNIRTWEKIHISICILIFQANIYCGIPYANFSFTVLLSKQVE